MRELQEKKLRRLVQHAYRHVRYYRRAFDERGIAPGDIRTLDDLHKLPFLSKNDVRENLYFDLLSDNHDKRRILRDHHQRLHGRAVRLLRRPATSSSSAGRRRSAASSGRAGGSATVRRASGTRRSA